MILVLAGTKDGRQLAAKLAQAGYEVIVSVISQHGCQLAAQDNMVIHTDKLDQTEMVNFIRNHNIKLVIDTSHPYAVNVSKNAINACHSLNVDYLRYERPATDLSSYKNLHTVQNYQEAACKAADLGKVVFLTTGSRMLETFKAEPKLQEHRIIARVLPDPDVIAKCVALGFSLSDIVALQGPFSHQLNSIMFKDYGAEVIVMKNSGQIGGSDTKLSAAAELNLPVIIINRPTVSYHNIVSNYDDILTYVKEVF